MDIGGQLPLALGKFDELSAARRIAAAGGTRARGNRRRPGGIQAPPEFFGDQRLPQAAGRAKLTAADLVIS